MSSLIYYYPVDLTGRNPTNHVNREAQLLVTQGGLSVRVFTLTHGGFYTRDLLIVDSAGKELRKDVDYVATYTYEDVADRTGLEVCGAIIITNPAITGIVYINAQMVGGDLAFTLDARQQVITHLLTHTQDPITWAGIVRVARQYAPGELHAELWEKVSHTAVNIEILNIAEIAKEGNQVRLMEYRALAKQLYLDYLAQFGNQVAAHDADTSNPHQTTKTQVGLGLVENYPMSTEAQARAGTDNATYMSPLQVKQQIETLGLAPLTAHVNRRDNPHATTAAQVGVPVRATVDQTALTKLGVNEQAVNATMVIWPPSTALSYNQFLDLIRTSIPAANFNGGGVFSPARLGAGYSAADYILRGNGWWTPIQDMVNLYAPQTGTPFYYVGYLSNESNAMSWISTTFSDVNAYPIGTIMMYRVNSTQVLGSAESGHSYASPFDISALRAATRTASGWSNAGGPPSYSYRGDHVYY